MSLRCVIHTVCRAVTLDPLYLKSQVNFCIACAPIKKIAIFIYVASVMCPKQTEQRITSVSKHKEMYNKQDSRYENTKVKVKTMTHIQSEDMQGNILDRSPVHPRTNTQKGIEIVLLEAFIL